MSLVTWLWIVSEAGVDLVLIETSLLFIYKSCCSYARQTFLENIIVFSQVTPLINSLEMGGVNIENSFRNEIRPVMPACTI